MSVRAHDDSNYTQICTHTLLCVACDALNELTYLVRWCHLTAALLKLSQLSLPLRYRKDASVQHASTSEQGSYRLQLAVLVGNVKEDGNATLLKA